MVIDIEEWSTLTYSSSSPITHLHQTERHLNPEHYNNHTIQMQRRKAKSHYFNSIFSHTLFVLPLTQDVVVGRPSLHFSLFYRLTHMALFSSFCSIWRKRAWTSHTRPFQRKRGSCCSCFGWGVEFRRTSFRIRNCSYRQYWMESGIMCWSKCVWKEVLRRRFQCLLFLKRF